MAWAWCDGSAEWIPGRKVCEQPEERTCKVGQPVLPGTGREAYAETDYAGAGAHPLEVTRQYRSLWVEGVAAGMADTGSRNGGWMFSMQTRMFELTERTRPLRRITRPDGRVVSFYGTPTSVGARTWSSSDGTGDRLLEQRDTAGVLTGWQYTVFADDSVESYDLGGMLQSVRQRNGWTTTLSYSTATTPVASYLSGSTVPRPGLLVSVRNQFGRELRLAYDEQGRVSQLLPPGAVKDSGAGNATSPIRYAYAEAASLGATAAQNQLTSVTWQDGTVKRYHYEDSRLPQALTGTTDEAGVRTSTRLYESSGRVTEEYGAGGADRILFAYSLPTRTTPAQTTITDYSGPNGSATARTYTFQSTGGVMRPTAVTAPCPLCGSTQASTAYDANGKVSKAIAHDGNVTFYAYDAKGRETERAQFASAYQGSATRPALNLASSVTSTKWHATWNLPLQVAEPGKVSAYTYDAKGNLTGQSWTATTDVTGAAKFAAVKTGSTYAGGYAYNASSLATTIIQKVDGVEARRWSYLFNALGDATKITATEAGTSSMANLASSTPHGLLTELTADNGAVARFSYDLRNQLRTAQMPDYGATLTYDARSLLTELRFSASSWLRIVYDQAGNPLRLEDSAGQSQLIVGLAEPTGIGARGQALKEAAAARMRALMSSLRDPAMTTRWLPLAAAQAQPVPPPAVTARILQGMSLAQTQQAALARDMPSPALERTCCSAGGQSSAQAVRDHLNRVTMPIQLMSYAATQASEAIADEILIQKSAYKLRKSLCAAGVAVLAGCHHAHHVVAVAHWKAAPARAVLDSVGIDINDAANGMFVPCDQHGRLHTYSYYDKVNLSITGSTKAQVLIQLGVVRAAIASGTY